MKNLSNQSWKLGIQKLKPSHWEKVKMQQVLCFHWVLQYDFGNTHKPTLEVHLFNTAPLQELPWSFIFAGRQGLQYPISGECGMTLTNCKWPFLYKFHGTHLFIIPNLLCTSFREFSVLWMISNRLLTHLRLMIKDTAYVLLPLDHSGIDKIWAQKQ
jgi:hypothetical protein